MHFTRFYYYKSSFNGARRIRTLEYSVPKNIYQYVQMIQPTTRFGQMQGERSTSFTLDKGRPIAEVRDYYQAQAEDTVLDATFCNTTITPTCLRELYSIGEFVPEPNNGILPKYERHMQVLSSFRKQDCYLWIS